VSEPTGTACPRRTNSTPAMKVVLTAPIPGVSTPNFPFGGATLTGLRIRFPPVPFVNHKDDENDKTESRVMARVIRRNTDAVAALRSRRVQELAFSVLRGRCVVVRSVPCL
jgi:hypothetical protein